MTNREAIDILRRELNDQLCRQPLILRDYKDPRETKRRLARLKAIQALRREEATND